MTSAKLLLESNFPKQSVTETSDSNYSWVTRWLKIEKMKSTADELFIDLLLISFLNEPNSRNRRVVKRKSKDKWSKVEKSFTQHKLDR